MAEMFSILAVLLASLIGSLGALMFKRGSEKFSISLSGLFRNRNFQAGVALYGTSTVLFVLALTGGELSVLYPLVSTVYIWTSLLSIKFLGESMNRYKWLGIILIMAGVAVIGTAHSMPA